MFQNGCSISLADLGFNGESKAAEVQTAKRTDSPVLESLDSDLAKYAKLKDLETTYDIKNQKAKPKEDKMSTSLIPCDNFQRRLPEGKE